MEDNEIQEWRALIEEALKNTDAVFKGVVFPRRLDMAQAQVFVVVFKALFDIAMADAMLGGE